MRKRTERTSHVGGQKHIVTVVEDNNVNAPIDWFVPLSDKFLMECQAHQYDAIIVPLPFEVSRLGRVKELIANVATSVNNSAALALAFSLGVGGCVQAGRIDYDCLKLCRGIIDNEIKKIEEKGE